MQIVKSKYKKAEKDKNREGKSPLVRTLKRFSLYFQLPPVSKRGKCVNTLLSTVQCAPEYTT